METRGSGIDDLRRELAARDEQIESLNNTIELLRSEVTRLTWIIAQRDEAIEFLQMELSFLSPDPAKQRRWWDDQFARSWELNAGPAQSTCFMKMLVESLGDSENSFLHSRRLRVLDWGCATGDGLRVFADTFPECEAVGMDLSEVAIDKAQKKFPDLTFVSTPDGELRDRFDVIVASNTLEHFAQPIEWLKRLLAGATSLVAVLVPFREHPLIEGHRFSFSDDSFPAALSGFTRLYTRVVQCDPKFWAGSQILAVYGSAAYARDSKT